MAANPGAALLPGAVVFVRDSRDVWRHGKVKKIAGNKCLVHDIASQEAREYPVDSVLPGSEQILMEMQSLTELSPISQASVLCCLAERYGNEEIYTSAGSTVVAVNPFRNISGLYTLEKILAYHRQKEECPHIYQIACEAYQHLCCGLGHIDQCIIVSGESGSGKTVSAKHLLRYMTVVSGSSLSSIEGQMDNFVHCVEQRILDSSPILEAFGNAVTQRNDNSSRFGKFIKLQFSRAGQMLGGEIHTYLLEKTRVVHQSDGEANFHIFYQVMESLSKDTESSLGRFVHSMGPDPFRALPVGKCINTNRDFSATLQAMTQLGLSDEAQGEITKILVAILFLCNVKISPLEEELCQLLSDKDDQFLDTAFMALEVTQSSLKQAACLLGLEASHIEQVMLYRNIESGGNKRRSVFVKPVPQREAISRRDCLATLLYSRLFEWLVKFINGQIKAEEFDHSIGLLDIYGFEAFETNSLEQLCINYANEKLQQHYVKQFLKDLQSEYEAECINWQHLMYTDNQLCLDILEGQPSVFGLLNEDVQLNRETNPSQICERIALLSRNSRYVKVARNYMKQPGFTVCHYAGDVTYSTAELTAKNRDNIPAEIVAMLQTSNSEFVSELFHDFTLEDMKGRKRKTVLGKFKVSLDSLLSSLNMSDVHYIRCIKPNRGSVPQVFDRAFVMSQLLAGGIIETVEISSRGYPIRMPYTSFLQRYGLILRNSSTPSVSESLGSQDSDTLYEPLDTHYKRQLDMLHDSSRKSNTPKKRLRKRAGLSSADHKRRCTAAVLKIQFGNCTEVTQQFGKTKLFLHQHQVDKLEEARFKILCTKASVIQQHWNRYKHRCGLRRRERMAEAARTIQQAWRKYTQHRQQAAVIVLQKTFRMMFARQKFRRLLETSKKTRNSKKKSWKPIMDRKRTSPGTGRSRSLRSSSRGQKSCESGCSSSSDGSVLITPSFDLDKSDDVFMSGISTDSNLNPPVTSTPCSKNMFALKTKGSSLESFEQSTLESNKENIRKKRLDSKGRPTVATLSPRKRTRVSPRQKMCPKPFNMETRETEASCNGDVSPVKKRKTDKGFVVTQEDLTVGDGILSRRRLPKVPIRFHTRASVLKNAHYVHQKELQCGLEDCLPNESTKTPSYM